MAIDPPSLKVVELRAELSKRGLSTKGKKDELIKRLTEHLNNQHKEEEEAKELQAQNEDTVSSTPVVEVSEDKAAEEVAIKEEPASESVSVEVAVESVEEMNTKSAEEVNESTQKESTFVEVEVSDETPKEESRVKQEEKLIERPAEEVIEKPAEELIERPAEELIERPAEELIMRPAEELIERPAEELIMRPAEELIERPAEELIEKPAEELIERPAEELIEKPAEELIMRPAEELIEKPKEDLIMRPAEELIEKPKEDLIMRPAEELIAKPMEESVEENVEMAIELTKKPVSSTTEASTNRLSEPSSINDKTDLKDVKAENAEESSMDVDLERGLKRKSNSINEGEDKRLKIEIKGETMVESVKSSAIYVKGFVRPLIIRAAQDLFASYGSVKRFWMDSIKTHCYVIYDNEQEAENAFTNVNGMRFPSDTGKNLSVGYLTPEATESLIAHEQAAADRRIKVEWERLIEDVKAGNPLPDAEPSPLRKSRSIGIGQIARQLAQANEPPAPNTKPVVEPEIKPRKITTLDDLFRKTATLPHLYYLPLNDEEAKVKLEEIQKSY
ncbi:hypothetical protein BDB01DRAFT_833626 [Pilobolus umbonatus]|nr:hypothetical protein BDB01DRAFT_833626 [Pilobolus umbonatus]